MKKFKLPNMATAFAGQKFSAKEQMLFAKRLSFLMGAGIPILESLQLIKRQIKNKTAAAMFDQIASDVAAGQLLAGSLAKFSGCFGSFAVNIIKVGEQGGILSGNLKFLAEELYKKQQLKSKIMGALIYPIFIVAATLILTLALTTVVFPKVVPIFASVRLDLPITTKIMMAVSRFLIHYGYLAALAALACGASLSFALRNQKFKSAAESALLRLPVLGRLLQNYYLANFCRTLGLLIKGESRLDEALRIAAGASEHIVYQREFYAMSAIVESGEKVSDFMQRRPKYFPDVLSHTVAIGEASGNLGETFLYLADMYEQEVDTLTKNLSGLIEPVLMVFMGLLVGFVAVSIITPIYAITQKLHP